MKMMNRKKPIPSVRSIMNIPFGTEDFANYCKKKRIQFKVVEVCDFEEVRFYGQGLKGGKWRGVLGESKTRGVKIIKTMYVTDYTNEEHFDPLPIPYSFDTTHGCFPIDGRGFGDEY